jgi:hypothetical protein
MEKSAGFTETGGYGFRDIQAAGVIYRHDGYAVRCMNSVQRGMCSNGIIVDYGNRREKQGCIRQESYATGIKSEIWRNDMFAIFSIIVIVIVFGIFIGATRTNPVLVLKEFRFNENEDEFLKIVGRASGILSWVLSLCGIDPITSLNCNRKAIKFEEAAIRYGKKTLSIPLIAVTGVSSGINKPFALLVSGIIFILGGILGAISLPGGGEKAGVFFIGLIIGAVFLAQFYLKKTMFFQIYNGGDKPIAAICMKKSIIEGQSIDELKFETAANALNKAVLGIHHILANAKNQNEGA